MHYHHRLNSIINAQANKLTSLVYPLPVISQECQYTRFSSILVILRDTGVIRGFHFNTIAKNFFIIYIKYNLNGKSICSSITIVSTPSRVVYLTTKSLWQPQTQKGCFVLSTNKGIITDDEARKRNLGGIVLFGIRIH